MSTTAAGLKSGPKGAYGVRSETDHIITISTASLTESHSESPAKGVVTPVRKPHSLGSEDSPENIIPGEQAETDKNPCTCAGSRSW